MIEKDKVSRSPSRVESSGQKELADNQLVADSNFTSLAGPEPPEKSGMYLTSFWCSQLIIALFICGWPNNDVEEAPRIAWLAQHIPEPYYSFTPW